MRRVPGICYNPTVHYWWLASRVGQTPGTEKPDLKRAVTQNTTCTNKYPRGGVISFKADQAGNGRPTIRTITSVVCFITIIVMVLVFFLLVESPANRSSEAHAAVPAELQAGSGLEQRTEQHTTG